jgi:hypothetical protein
MNQKINSMIHQLDTIRKAIQEKENLRGVCEAELRFNLNQLKEKYSCKSLQEAKDLLSQLLNEMEEEDKRNSKTFESIIAEATDKGLLQAPNTKPSILSKLTGGYKWEGK